MAAIIVTGMTMSALRRHRVGSHSRLDFMVRTDKKGYESMGRKKE